MKKAKIGVVLDYEQGSEKSYSKQPHYAIRANYVEMIAKQGAMAILLPYDHGAIEQYCEMIDGLMIVGGAFDIDPKRYGEKFVHPKTQLKKTRENFEFALVGEFLKTKKPLFGICNGMQLINVLYGGGIIQDILDENKGYMNHEQSKAGGGEGAYGAYHEVRIEEDSMLYEIAKKSELKTNSSHHQAIGEVGAGLKINARTDDGIVEGIEDPKMPFCLGLQWHPEFEVNEADHKVFAAFVAACGK